MADYFFSPCLTSAVRASALLCFTAARKEVADEGADVEPLKIVR
jgi:hypothetical protein